MVLRLIASSTAAIPSTTVEPAAAISIVTVISVSETSVVTANRPTSASTATMGAESVAYDHGDHDHRHNHEEHSHPNSPFTGFPRFRLQSTCGRSTVATHGWYASVFRAVREPPLPCAARKSR